MPDMVAHHEPGDSPRYDRWDSDLQMVASVRDCICGQEDCVWLQGPDGPPCRWLMRPANREEGIRRAASR